MRKHPYVTRVVAGCASLILVMSSLLAGSPAAIADSTTAQGCMNQWLFNGVWRTKVTKVEPIMDGGRQTGWQVTQVWRNGTSRELAPADSMLEPEQLAISGSTLEAEGHRQEGLAFNTNAPSGQFTYTQTFFAPNMTADPANKPKALDISFDGAKLETQNKPHFTSKKYNFHFDLGCVASGAAAEAQGGSTQLAAVDGCMNQWMSNGVWKMRVTKVGPNPPDATAANQGGWAVAQEWVNMTRVKVYPSGISDPGQHVAPTNVSDEFLATKNGNNASSFNMVGGFAIGSRNVPFAPGSSYAFTQNFSWSPFDSTDAPTRLLVTFDVASQNKVGLPYAPHYHKPANFRINLTCGGSVTMAPGQPAPSSPAAAQPAASNLKVDPCAMLSAPDVASALGVGVQSLGTAQRRSSNECAWAAAAHGGAPARNVLLVMQTAQTAKAPCHGFGCLHVVQSVLGTAGLPGVPPQFSEAFNDAQLISDLGDKASWKDGRLTVVKADTAFQLLVHTSGSPALATSENLARDVLNHLSP